MQHLFKFIDLVKFLLTFYKPFVPILFMADTFEIDKLNRRLKPVLDQVIETLFSPDARGSIDLEFTDTPGVHPGWHDCQIGDYYVTLFDLDFEAARRIMDLFNESSSDGELYTFSPTPDFSVMGILRKQGIADNVAYAILHQRLDMTSTNGRGDTKHIFPYVSCVNSRTN